MAGRRTKLTDEVTAKICEAIRAGNTRRAACAYAGISDQTFANWCRDSLDFLESVKKAEADCEVSFAAVIKKAAAGHDVYKKVTKTKIIEGVPVTEVTETVFREYAWQAAAWWLERRRPEDYKPRTLIENLDVTSLSDEDLERLATGSGTG